MDFLGAAFLRATGLRFGFALTVFFCGEAFLRVIFFLDTGFLFGADFAVFPPRRAGFLDFFLVAIAG